jgi:putative flippase GtrA
MKISGLLKDRRVRYLIAGGSAAVVEYLLFVGFIYILAMSPGLAQGMCFLLGAIVSFLLQALWSFKRIGRDRHNRRRQFIFYLTRALVNMAITSLIVGIVVPIGVPAWIAKIFMMGFVVVWNYIVLSRVIFTKAH